MGQTLKARKRESFGFVDGLSYLGVSGDVRE